MATVAFRVIVTLLAFVVTRLAADALLRLVPGVGANLFAASLLSLVLAVAGAGWVWRRSARRGRSDLPPRVIESTVRGALLVGGVGFVGGFFGPLIFAPDANQGPLLGIFITGPIGVVLGGIAGFVRGLRAVRSAEQLPADPVAGRSAR